MTWDYEAQREKEDELKGHLAKAADHAGIPAATSARVAESVFDASLRTTPPEEASTLMHLVTMNNPGGRGGGRSRKLGNIRLDLGKLVEVSAESGLLAATAITIPWTILFAGVLFLCRLKGLSEVSLSENDAVVLFVLHRLKDGKKLVADNSTAITSEVNTQLRKYQCPQLKEADIKHALKNLSQIRAIKKSKDGSWFVVEWIKVKYG